MGERTPNCTIRISVGNLAGKNTLRHKLIPIDGFSVNRRNPDHMFQMGISAAEQCEAVRAAIQVYEMDIERRKMAFVSRLNRIGFYRLWTGRFGASAKKRVLVPQSAEFVLNLVERFPKSFLLVLNFLDRHLKSRVLGIRRKQAVVKPADRRHRQRQRFRDLT
jgi:hypothetical protein